jgi:PPOX class probable F420-dependent enzyme
VTDVTPEVAAFMRKTRVAVISTVDGRGHPRSAPVWFLWDGAAPVLFTSRATLKWRNIEARPYASLCIDERDGTYESVIIDGRVEEATDRDLAADVLTMSLAYWGEDRGRAFAEGYRGDRPDIALFRIVPERIVYQRSQYEAR